MSKQAETADRGTSGLEAWAAPVSAVAALLFALPFVLGGGDFCLDDAWIHLSYAKSVRLGDGLSYNPGDWQTGFSSPLWVLLLAVWPTGSDPVIPVKLLGALFHALTAWLAVSIVIHLGRARASVSHPLPLLSMAMLAGVLVAAQPTLLQGATSGMAVSLAAALVLATVLTTLRDAPAVAVVVGALAVLARPEVLFFVAAFCVLLAVVRRSVRPLAALGGSALGMTVWIIHCLAVSGWPWPNTRYVKATGGGLDGITYLLGDVLPWQPWLVGLGGVVLIGLAVRRELMAKPRSLELTLLLVAWVSALIAVAVSRPLHPGVLFFESRYFAIFAAVPPILIAFGIAHTRRWLAVLLVVPIAVLSGLQVTSTHARQRDQERGIELLHSAPARYAASHLPADAVLAVEGAGAMRYFTPRTMTVVDALGLNDTAIAHAPDTPAQVCALLQRRPTHTALPPHIQAPLESVFEFESTTTFTDPAYAQTQERHPQDLVIAEVKGVREKWRSRCALDPG